MDPNKPERESKAGQPGVVQMPPVVNTVLIFFYGLMWLNIAYATYSAVEDAGDGDYGFLIPVALYVLLFIAQFVAGRRQYRRVGGTLSDQLWGYDDPRWRQFAFICLCFALIFWMNLESINFLFTYLPLIPFTLGTFWGRTGIALAALEFLALTYQMGLFGSSGTARLSSGAVIGISISLVSFLMSIILIIVLMRSRIQSEILVQELQATKLQLEEALAKEKEVAVLRERDRMAREMHDVLGHALVLVAVKIEAAQRLQAVDPERAAAELETTKELVRQSMADLRASLADLRSPALEAGSKPLGQALQEWATRTTKEVGLMLKCEVESEIEALPAPIQDALWRVGREAVLNVVKHARAKQVEINVFAKDGITYLSVNDDGVGIPHLAEGSARLEVEGHYGIRGMRERVETLGGRLAIKPGRDGRGTLVLASVPLPPPEPEPAQRMRERLSPAKKLLLRKNQ